MPDLPTPGATERTQVHRLPKLAVHDRAKLSEILDEGIVAHVGVVDAGGQPFTIPCGFARDGDRVLLHGSNASRLFRTIASGAPICVTVTLLDGLTYGRSLFESSMRYRSAVVLGRGEQVGDGELLDGLLLLADKLLPGRVADARQPNERELAQTMLVSVPLDEVSVKVGVEFATDQAEDLDLPYWAGVLPLQTVAGAPIDAPDLGPNRPVPSYVTDHPLRNW